jgi:hypothetical protein
MIRGGNIRALVSPKNLNIKESFLPLLMSFPGGFRFVSYSLLFILWVSYCSSFSGSTIPPTSPRTIKEETGITKCEALMLILHKRDYYCFIV